ncbi:hypothetical protein G7046_g9442 [Stylonectria norvegica]|nr:hypothetical protein G7046_g9442 [Stylonectria norvegica]
MTPKPRYLRMEKDDLAWEQSDNDVEAWERSLHKADIFRAIGKFILQYRPGEAVELHKAIRGGFNAVYRLEYKDGTSAVMRIPCKGVVKFPEEKTRYEVATMQYIAENTTIPVPKIYHSGSAEENPTGLGPFIIMEYIDHEMTLSAALNDPALEPDARHVLDPNISDTKLKYLYGQMANILLQLSSLRFPQIGSLIKGEDGAISVSGRPIFQNMNALVEVAAVNPDLLPTQTYRTSDEWYSAMADMHMAQLTFQHNDAIEGDDEDDAREKYIVRQLFRRLASQGRLASGLEDGDAIDEGLGFRLYSEDLRPSNVLVDQDLRVVGVIDWEFAYVAPGQFSFDPPWWLLLKSPEFWPGGYRSWMEVYEPCFETFLAALEDEEKKMEATQAVVDKVDALPLSRNKNAPEMPLSQRMRQRWKSKAWMVNFAARNSWVLDFIFWKFLDPVYFGPNEDEDYRIRLGMLSREQLGAMEDFVNIKMEESRDRKLITWDSESAVAHLAKVMGRPDIFLTGNQRLQFGYSHSNHEWDAPSAGLAPIRRQVNRSDGNRSDAGQPSTTNREVALSIIDLSILAQFWHLGLHALQMGIKGIYRELGPGKRVSLSKLAADSILNVNRPFRLAIDIAIWQFQTQAARGGTNPAIRTLFYRLTRLLATPIEPIFVFDGPNKPAFKRNKRSSRGDGVATAQAKRLIRLFGFAVHDAPGEAEAECALLQQHGIVDAVLSEDVDTIMFGATRTLRNWSSEGKGSKTPTHVSLYDVQKMNIAELGLDREGMVLVALMSGGDYLPDGIPGCGVKVACEAAKAGFGKTVCRLKATDKAGMQAWREELVHELQTNEAGHFRTRHKALAIPEDFPNLEVLRYYTHPVVSQTSTLNSVREKFHQKKDMHLDALREFTRETFDWDYRIGAIKFIRVLGQAILVDSILYQQDSQDLVKRISGRRTHFSADATPELRLSYVPQDVVPIDLSKEVDEETSQGRDGLALNSDDEFEAPTETLEGSRTITTKIYDPSKPELAWVLEAVAKRSIPEAVVEWEAAEAAKAVRKAPAKKKTTAAKGKKGSGMRPGALEQFVRTSKPSRTTEPIKKPTKATPPSPSPPRPTTPRRFRIPSPLEPSKQPAPTLLATGSPTRQRTTPWTLASSQVTPRTATPKARAQAPGCEQQAILISSSPPGSPPSPPSPSPRRRRPIAGGKEMSGSIREILAGSRAAERLREERGSNRGKKAAQASSPPRGSQGFKMKQTSMDMFATRLEQPPSKSQSTKQPSLELQSTKHSTSEFQSSKHPSSEFQGSQHSSTETKNTIPRSTQPLPTTSLPPSPSKRRQTTAPPTTRSSSPTPARKKKLLVPRTSAVGFYREVEFDADEREEHLAALKRRGKGVGVARLSDVTYVDLTGED